MTRLSGSSQTFRVSLRVLSRDLELLVLPILSFLSMAAVIAGTWLVGGFGDESSASLALWLVGSLVGWYTSLLCNAAVIVIANERLLGGDATLRDGLRVAHRQRRQILRWALYSMTVGAFVRAAGSIGGSPGRIAADLGWAAATYFVVPFIVLEDVNHRVARERSLEMCKRHFGDSVIAASAVGAVMLLLFAPLLVLGLAFEPISTEFTVWGLITLAALASLFGTTLSGIYRATAYRYAIDGAVTHFTDEELRTTFIRRR